MKIVIACSKNWFSLDKDIFCKDEVIFIKEKKDLTLQFLREISPKFVFFPHWNWFVDEEIIENFDCILFHTAPLPFGRGGSPIQNQIMEGITHTKLNAMVMSDKLDAGDVYCSESLTLQGSLFDVWMSIAETAVKIIKICIKDNPRPVPQKETSAKVYRRRRENSIPKDCDSLYELYRYIQMLDAEGYDPANITFGGYNFEFSRSKFNSESIVCDVKIRKENGKTHICLNKTYQ